MKPQPAPAIAARDASEAVPGTGHPVAILMSVDTHRLLTLGILATFYVASAMASGAVAVYRARTAPRLFAASLSELSKDRRQLPSGP